MPPRRGAGPPCVRIFCAVTDAPFRPRRWGQDGEELCEFHNVLGFFPAVLSGGPDVGFACQGTVAGHAGHPCLGKWAVGLPVFGGVPAPEIAHNNTQGRELGRLGFGFFVPLRTRRLGPGGGGRMVKRCARSITSLALFQPSCLAVQTWVLHVRAPSLAMRAIRALGNGPLECLFSAMCLRKKLHRKIPKAGCCAALGVDFLRR